MSAADWSVEEPVTGMEGDPDFGSCRVCQYQDADTGALMYRIEKESSPLEGSAELICQHVSAAYCRRLLAAMKQDMGGELKARGALLLIAGVPLPPMPPETRRPFPNPDRRTQWSPNGVPDTPSEADTPPPPDQSGWTGSLF